MMRCCGSALNSVLVSSNTLHICVKVVNDINRGVKIVLQLEDMSNSIKEDNMRHKTNQ